MKLTTPTAEESERLEPKRKLQQWVSTPIERRSFDIERARARAVDDNEIVEVK